MGLEKSDRVFSSSSFSSSYYLLILSPLLHPQDQIQAALGGGAGRDADGRDQGRGGEVLPWPMGDELGCEVGRGNGPLRGGEDEKGKKE